MYTFIAVGLTLFMVSEACSGGYGRKSSKKHRRIN